MECVLALVANRRKNYSILSCIDENAALQYVEGQLSADKARAVDAHVADCEECRWLLSDAASAALKEVPSAELMTEVKLHSPSNPPDLVPVPITGPRTGQRVGKYLVGKLIGKGGMGNVYDASVGAKHFAIKFLNEAILEDRAAVSRFKREAEITSRLKHPNIVHVIEFHPEADAYIVMELLEGESLRNRLHYQTQALDLKTIVSIIRQATAALSAAHAEGVIHRDLKPANIYLCGGEMVKVMDFGVSKVMGVDSSLTSDGALVGSPGYMAPEQINAAGAVDHRVDIFSLGAILHEMLTGAAPFAADSLPAVIFKAVYEEPSKTARWSQLPEAFKDVLARALSKEPEARQPSMVQLWRDVARALRRSGFPELVEDDLAVTTIHTMNRMATTVRPPRERELATTKKTAKGDITKPTKLPVALPSNASTSKSKSKSVEPPNKPVESPTSKSIQSPKSKSKSVPPVVTASEEPLPATATTGRRGSLWVSATLVIGAAVALALWIAIPPGEEIITLEPDLHLIARHDPPDASPTRPPIETVDLRSQPPTKVPKKAPTKASKRVKPTSNKRSHSRRVRPVKRPRIRHGDIKVQSKDAASKYLWADVYLDGRKVGQTPLTIEKVRAGRQHRVVVRRPGYRSETRSLFLTEKGKTLTFTLRPQ